MTKKLLCLIGSLVLLVGVVTLLWQLPALLSDPPV